MKNLNKEREVLAQLYANNADVTKYLPFFFNNIKDLQNFFDVFGGKTLKLPKTFEDFVEGYFKIDSYCNNRNTKGINGTKNMKIKILESYINLFDSLDKVIENECKDNKV